MLSALALFVVLVLYLVKVGSRPKLPGPRKVPFFGNAWLLTFTSLRDIYAAIKKQVDKYGGVVEFEFVGHFHALLTEPETVEPLLNSTAHNKKANFDYQFWIPFLNDGLLLSNGAKWQYRRKLLTPSFHFKILEDALGSLSKNALQLTSNLLATGGKPVDVANIIRLTTLRVICETAMGVELDTRDETQREYVEAINRIPEAIMSRGITFWLRNDFIYNLTKAGKDFYKDLNIVHSFTKKIIANRRELWMKENQLGRKNINNKKKAFLDILLEIAYGSENATLTEDDICEEVDTFMFEGHDTTSTTLMFTIYLIANHLEEQEKVAEEMIGIFGDDDRPPTMEDLVNMNYLEMVIKESLRLYPSVPMFSRDLDEDLKINEDITIPAGYTAAVVSYYLHRSKKVWDNPEEFIPERFLPGIQRHPFAYIPFSAGPRNCIGQKFAMKELKTLLSTVMRKCRFEAVTKKLTILPTPIMKSEEPIVVRVYPRNA